MKACVTSGSGVASPKVWELAKKFGGSEMFDFRQATIFLVGRRFSKPKMTRYSKHLGGTWPPSPHRLRL